jgi:formylglycine-generating enzyme required for sulfatase activity
MTPAPAFLALGWLVAAPGHSAERPRFVEVPAGAFVMGCEPVHKCSEALPRRSVAFDAPFWIAATETSVRQFEAFAKATGYRTTAETAGDARTWRRPGFERRPDQPVVYMTLRDAEAYCSWIGARLPSESEWEYAARAGATTAHFWGDEIDDRYLWYRNNSDWHPQPVGTKLPNRWGLHDVEGNAWEWATGGGAHTSVTLPDHATIRGGGWLTCPEPYPPVNGVRSRQISLSVPFHGAPRQNFKADFRRDDSGFRCARSTAP